MVKQFLFRPFVSEGRERLAVYLYAFVVLTMLIVPPWHWRGEQWRFVGGAVQVAYIPAAPMAKPGGDTEDTKEAIKVLRAVSVPIEQMDALLSVVGGDRPVAQIVRYSPFFYRPYMGRFDFTSDELEAVGFAGILWSRLWLEVLTATCLLLTVTHPQCSRAVVGVATLLDRIWKNRATMP